jgi:hypothetical protein
MDRATRIASPTRHCSPRAAAAARLRLRQRLHDDSLAGRCGMAALDAMGAAVLLLDGQLGVLFASAAGHALLDAPLRQGPPPALARAVRLVIASMDVAPQCQCLRLPRSQARALVLTVAPFPAWHAPAPWSSRATRPARPCRCPPCASCLT